MPPKKAGRPKGSKNVKKITSVKQAYKKNVKNQMMLRRAPVVEFKQRVSSDIALLNGHPLLVKDDDEAENYDYLTQGDLEQPLNWRLVPNTNAFTLIPLNSFYRQQQGLKPYQMIGDTITSRWLNHKIEVRFPQGEIFPKVKGSTNKYRNMMIQENYKLYWICGWITHAINAPLTAPGSKVARPLDEWTQADIKNFIQSELEPYFDQSIDKLSFRPKETMNVKIEKYQRIKPKLDSSIATQAQAVKVMSASTGTGQLDNYNQASGSIPNVMKTHSFNFGGRKTLYSEGYPATQGSQVDYQNLLPNNSYLPFSILYAPDFGNLDAVQHQTAGTKDPVSRTDFSDAAERRTSNIFVRFNDQMVYTDS